MDNHFSALQGAGTALSFMELIKLIKKFNLHWRIQLSMCLDITSLLLLRGGHLLNTSPPSVKTSFSQLLKWFSTDSGCWFFLNHFRFWLLVGQPDGCEGGVYISSRLQLSRPPRLQLTNCWRQGRSKSAAARHHSAAGRSSPVLLLIAH